MNAQLTPRINRLEPNVIIGGGMEYWGDGLSRTVASGTSAYGATLFKLNNATSGVTLTNSRQTSAPSNTNLVYSNSVSKTLAGSLASGTNTAISYYVEGFDLDRLMTNTFSVIFWARSSVASLRSLALTNDGFTHSIVKQYQISAPNTWEMKVVTFPSMNSCPGTLNRTNGVGFQLWFSIVNGTAFQTSNLNVWQPGSALSGLGEDSTWLTGTTHSFEIAGAMILPGDFSGLTASGYEFVRAGKNFADEMQSTLRYYEKSYLPDVAPGTASSIAGSFFQHNPIGSNSIYDPQVTFIVEKRAIPSLNGYNPVTGANGTARQVGGADTNLTVGFSNAIHSTGTKHFVAVVNQILSAGSAGFHWTADARF